MPSSGSQRNIKIATKKDIGRMFDDIVEKPLQSTSFLTVQMACRIAVNLLDTPLESDKIESKIMRLLTRFGLQTPLGKAVEEFRELETRDGDIADKNDIQYASLRATVLATARAMAPEQFGFGAFLPQTFEVLQEAFQLNDSEVALIYLSSVAARVRSIDAILDELVDSVDIKEAVAYVTGYNYSQVYEELSSNRLYSAGLLEQLDIDTFREIASPTAGMRLILAPSFKTAKDMRDFIIGPEAHTQLSASSFPHMTKSYERLGKLLKGAADHKAEGVNILFYGQPGAGKTEFAKALAQASETSGRMVGEIQHDFTKAPSSARLDHYKMLQQIMSHATRDVLIFDEAEDVFRKGGFSSDKNELSKLFLNRMFENNPKPAIWIVNDIDAVPAPIRRRMTAAIRFGRVPKSIRLEIAEHICTTQKANISSAAIIAIDDIVPLNPGLVSNACKQIAIADLGDDDFAEAYKDIWEGYHTRKFPKKPLSLSQSFNPALCATSVDLYRLRDQIVAGKSKTLSFCLHGMPGTGKSCFARWIVKEMDLPILEKRASDLLGSFVGETEKNIRRAFISAKEKGAALVIDEADSFLGDRTHAVRSWEITQVNEFLRALEDHPYPVICTTNMLDHLDPAALRRFLFKIEFSAMEPKHIDAAFKQYFGRSAPTALQRLENLTAADFDLVKKRMEMLALDVSIDVNVVRELMEELKVKGPVKGQVGFAA